MDKKQELASLVSRIDSYLQKKYKIESKKEENEYKEITSLLSQLVTLFKTFKLEVPKDLLKPPQITVKAPEVNVPAPIVNVPKAQPIVNVVERDYSESINKELKKVQKLLESVKIDSSAKNPLAVRLSDGDKFIEQLTNIVTQTVGGGSGTPTVATTVDGIRGVPVVNPDGSNITDGLSVSTTPPAGAVDSNNSTTTPLTGNAVFTGTSTDVKDYSAITVLLDTDQAGTLKIQFSNNGSDWYTGEEYTIPAVTLGQNKFFTPPLQGRYFRIVYTNGSTPQTRFKIHTVLKPNAIKWSSHNINSSLHDDDDAELVAAVLKLRTAQNNYVSGSATNGGNFKVSLEEYNGDVATGGLPVAGDVGKLDQLDLTNSNPATVAIVDANGDQITSFGGGTQYTEGDTDATITGTAIMFESNVGTNAVSVVNQDTPLPIQIFGPEAVSIANIETNTAYLSTIESNTGGVNAGMNTVGNAIGSQGMAVVGTDGTNARILKTDTDGELQVDVKSLPASALADTTANPTVPGVGAYLMGFNGTTWDRAHVLYSTAEDEPTQTGVFVIPMNRVFDGTNWDRMPGNSTDGTLVNLGANNDVTISGTATTKETRSATPSQTSVNDTNASTTILASNANRLGATIANDSSAVLYLLLGSGSASSTNYTARVSQYGYYEVPYNYTGQINGIWASDPNDGGARITELT